MLQRKLAAATKISLLLACFLLICEGYYSCVPNRELFFVAHDSRSSQPKLEIGPFSQFHEPVASGSRLLLSCCIKYSAPGTNIRWVGDGCNFDYIDNSDKKYEKTIFFGNITRNCTGNYTCLAETVQGILLNKTIHIKVGESGHITAEPRTINVKLNEPVTLSCHVRGYPLSDFIWKHKVVHYTPEPWIYVNPISGNMTNTSYVSENYVIMNLHVTSVTHEDRGTYWCSVTDSSGLIHDLVYLNVLEVPRVNVTLVQALGVGTVYLTWQTEEIKTPVEKYWVQYVRSGTNQWQNHSRTFDRYKSHAVFRKLASRTAYQFRISAINSVGHSEFAYSEWVTTLEKDPEFVPNIWIVATTLHSITVGWSPPPPELQRYFRCCDLTLTSGDVMKPSYRSHEQTFVFEDLAATTSYKMKIIACKWYTMECENSSKEIEAVTMDRDPKFIPTVSIKATTLDFIKIGWTAPPPELEDRVHQYKAIASHDDEIRGPIYLAKTKNSYVFENLNSTTVYQFKVAACSEYKTQCADWSAEQEATTIDRDPKFTPNVSIVATTLDSIKIGWTVPPTGLQDRVHQYKVMATHGDDNREPIYLSNTNNDYVFENLNSTTIYRFKVTACSEYKTQCGNSSEEQEGVTVDRDPKFIPNVSIEATTLDSITIRWTAPPTELQDRVRQYKVLATSQGNTSEQVYSTANSYVFTDLEPETNYQLKVAACSEYKTQCGNWSTERKTVTIERDQQKDISNAISPGLIVTPVLLVIIVIWLGIWVNLKIHREKASKRRFMEATLERFNAGAMESLNPEMNIGDQAEFLPYDKNWEYPRELMKLGKVLGRGAFGVVRKAEAESICQAGEVTTVAVKMVLPTARLHCMTALTRELKILAHLGKHLNVVNLLGACTKKISYGELLVIVEFCYFGNLHDYLLHRRRDFVNELDTVPEKMTGSNFIEDGINVNDSGMNITSSGHRSATEDRCQSVDLTDVSVAVDDNVPEIDLAVLDQRVNYHGDYKIDQNLKPICTRDLISWAWQVSRGMEYLGSRKILHGDLAARNILLADNYVVKICDFGLAKALYAEDNYEKKGHDPLPLKWMAIESIRDRVFSIKSDVWSYGIVLWEFFTLAETPYRGIEQENIYEKLVDGFRMTQPKYAADNIYRMMLQCWDMEPSNRPFFEDLVELLADLLDESVKMHYIELSAPYARINTEAAANGKPDYLTTITPEDASNTIAPSHGED